VGSRAAPHPSSTFTISNRVRHIDQTVNTRRVHVNATDGDLVAEAVRVYLEQLREELRAGMVEALRVLDGSLKADVMMLTGLTSEEIDAVGGTEE
jgi:hypothetical protein